MLLSWIERTGKKLIKVLANAGGADEAWFNPGDGHTYFLASTARTRRGKHSLAVVDSLTDQERPPSCS